VGPPVRNILDDKLGSMLVDIRVDMAVVPLLLLRLVVVPVVVLVAVVPTLPVVLVGQALVDQSGGTVSGKVLVLFRLYYNRQCAHTQMVCKLVLGILVYMSIQCSLHRGSEVAASAAAGQVG